MLATSGKETVVIDVRNHYEAVIGRFDGQETKEGAKYIDPKMRKSTDFKNWLEKQPRFHLHFTPTSASWLNLVERFFRDITVDRIRRGVFRSVEELKQAIMDYLKHRNDNPKPYVWTAKPEKILNKFNKAKELLGTLH